MPSNIIKHDKTKDKWQPIVRAVILHFFKKCGFNYCFVPTLASKLTPAWCRWCIWTWTHLFTLEQ